MNGLTELQKAQSTRDILSNMIKTRQAEYDRLQLATIQADIDSWTKQIADLDAQITALQADDKNP